MARKLARMPGNWYPAQYWASAGAWGFGSWAVFASAVKGIQKYYPMMRRAQKPHSITVTLSVGNSIELVLRHKGEPAIWSADARIVRMLKKNEHNPDPAPFECEFFKSKGVNTRMRLTDDEWATITLAILRDIRGPWLGIYHHPNLSIGIPYSGVVLEVEIKSEPKSRTSLKKYYEIKLDNLCELVAKEVDGS